METLRQIQMPGFLGRGVLHKTGAPILQVSGVTVQYNGRFALENVSFHLTQGERMAVVGPNGAGKSTLFKVIVGMVQPNRGTVSVYGHGPGGHHGFFPDGLYVFLKPYLMVGLRNSLQVSCLNKMRILRRGLCLIENKYL